MESKGQLTTQTQQRPLPPRRLSSDTPHTMARLSMLVLAALALIAALLSTAANAQGMSGGVAVAPR